MLIQSAQMARGEHALLKLETRRKDNDLMQERHGAEGCRAQAQRASSIRTLNVFATSTGFSFQGVP